jgi:hypothetical protein
LTELFWKVKLFKFDTVKYCARCSGRVTETYCSRCGFLEVKDLRRGFLGVLLLDIFENDILCAGDESVLELMLNRVGISIRQDDRDKLKGLRPPIWGEVWWQVKRSVEKAVYDYYISTQRIIHVSGTMREKFFQIKNFVKMYDLLSPEIGKYVEGSQSELLIIARNVLIGYEKTPLIWGEGEIPVMVYSKEIENEEIKIGIRAPVAQYGKAYHLWMRVNDIPMYPARPVCVGGSSLKEVWVYRVYHTKNWKANLEKRLQHFVSLEGQAVRVVRATRKIDLSEIKDILPDELSTEEREDILKEWQRGSLWDLVKIVSKINRSVAVKVLKMFGFLKEP